MGGCYGHNDGSEGHDPAAGKIEKAYLSKFNAAKIIAATAMKLIADKVLLKEICEEHRAAIRDKQA